MEQKIKKIIEMAFGTKENIMLKLKMTLGFLGLLFFILAFVSVSEEVRQVYAYTSGILIGIWIILLKGFEDAYLIIWEAFRLFFFSLLLTWSLINCLEIYVLGEVKNIARYIISCVCLIGSCFYFSSKITDIFGVIKQIFKEFKNKLFDGRNEPASKVKALIENITAFLVAIGALMVAVFTILSTAVQIKEVIGI